MKAFVGEERRSVAWRLGGGARALAGAAMALALTSSARADNYGHAEPGQIGFQAPVTDLARYLQWFHNDILMPLITVISLFVLALLAYVVWRFNEKANPVPSKTTHNTLIEVVWTIAPVIILVFVAIPSFRLLTMQFTFPPADLTDDKELKPDDLRLLAVDNEAVVPVNKVVHLEVTSTDVIHSFIVQSFGVRIDAVPGRLNKIWFKADREGVYYGQCSKICGKDHAFMPIAFRVVSQEQYDAWLLDAKKKYASVENPVQVADDQVRH